MKAIFFTDDHIRLGKVFNERHISEIKDIIGDFDGKAYSKEDVVKNQHSFADVEYIFSTWGLQPLAEEEIRLYFPKLKCLFYAAGTVQKFGRQYINCGVRVFSAWAANAVPVAEYCVAQIVLANKGFFAASRDAGKGEYNSACRLFRSYEGNYDTKIGIIGAGMIGKTVIGMLRQYKVEIMVFDPFLPEKKAEELGVKKVSLQKLFSECNVISNHLADNINTKNMLDYGLFSKMIPYSTFINTGRGAQVVEDDLIRVLKERTDVFALLDVTYPEPPSENSGFYGLDNCILTPHMAGASGNEFWRLADYSIDSFKKYLKNEYCDYEIVLEMLETMA